MLSFDTSLVASFMFGIIATAFLRLINNKAVVVPLLSGDLEIKNGRCIAFRANVGTR